MGDQAKKKNYNTNKNPTINNPKGGKFMCTMIVLPKTMSNFNPHGIGIYVALTHIYSTVFVFFSSIQCVVGLSKN